MASDDTLARELQTLLDALPAPLEPLDPSMLDGFLCGVLVQPRRIDAARWMSLVVDVEGRAAPAGADLGPLRTAVLQRLRRLDEAIEARQWFDPWVFELDTPAPETDDAAGGAEAAAPWAAGFALALESFPALLESDEEALVEPLALVYQHVGTEHLDEAEALQEEIESLEPPEDLPDAVEQLVRATLLLADVGRPRRQDGGRVAPGAVRRPRPRR